MDNLRLRIFSESRPKSELSQACPVDASISLSSCLKFWTLDDWFFDGDEPANDAIEYRNALAACNHNHFWESLDSTCLAAGFRIDWHYWPSESNSEAGLLWRRQAQEIQVTTGMHLGPLQPAFNCHCSHMLYSLRRCPHCVSFFALAFVGVVQYHGCVHAHEHALDHLQIAHTSKGRGVLRTPPCLSLWKASARSLKFHFVRVWTLVVNQMAIRCWLGFLIFFLK